MRHPCQWLNQVPVGCPGEVEHDLDGLVVGGLELLHLPAAKLPQLRPSEMRVIDAVNSELGLWLGKVKFLINGVVFLNISSILGFQVKLATINHISNCISQMLDLINPWQRVPTQRKAWKCSGFS